MSMPPQTNFQIHALDRALTHYIQQAESGHNDPSDLYDIEKQLTTLTNHPQIPQVIRENLQSALKEFQQIQSGVVNLDHLYNVKIQLDHAMNAAKEPGIEKKLGGSLD